VHERVANHAPTQRTGVGMENGQRNVSWPASTGHVGKTHIVDLITDFKHSLEGRRPSTIRLYVAGAKAAMQAARVCAGYDSIPQILASIREHPPGNGHRIAPFLRYLERETTTDNPFPPGDVLGIQYWAAQVLAKRLKVQKNPSIAARRDMALMAAACAAPVQGDPRRWPRECLKTERDHVVLWDQRVEERAFALALSLWYAWRERLARPDQRRLYRKSIALSDSKLLFPGPHGAPLSRTALHNALRRIRNGVGEGSCGGLTPQKIRTAFLLGDPLGQSSRSDRDSDGFAAL
jgi:hypothetical protein